MPQLVSGTGRSGACYRHLQQKSQCYSPFRRKTAALLLGASAVLTACDSAKKDVAAAPPAPPPPVTFSVPIRKEVQDWDEYAGHLQSPERADVQAQVSGVIVETSFKEGALVHKGDVLFRIDPRPFQADLDNKKAALAKDEAQRTLAEAELRRSDNLLKTNAVSQADYDTAKARFDQAGAQLAADKAAQEVTELNLAWTKVTAPITGRVSRIYVTVGNLLNGSTGQPILLTTIVSMDPMYCMVVVPERTYLNYQAWAVEKNKINFRDARAPCFIQLENEKDFPHRGVIDFVDNNIDTDTGTMQLRASLSNPDGTLTPGAFARMRVTYGKPYQTLLIPDIAIGTEQNERFVLIVGKDDVVESRPVTLGRTFGNLRSIMSGLKPEDRVVVNGLQQARPGAKVNPTKADVSLDSLSPFEKALLSDKLSQASSGGNPEAMRTQEVAAKP